MARQLLLAFVMLLALIPAGAAGATQGARWRMVHATPDAPKVDVYLDDKRVLDNLGYFTATAYLSAPAGERRVRIVAAGDALDRAILDVQQTLEDGRAYTLAATGSANKLALTVLRDDLSAPTSGKARVRAIHFAPGAPAVDVGLKGGDRLIKGLGFPKDSGYIELAGGSYDIQVYQAGSANVALELPALKVEAGKIYDFFAVGFLFGLPPLSLQTVASEAATAPTSLPSTGAAQDGAPWLLICGALLLGAGLAMQRTRRNLQRRS